MTNLPPTLEPTDPQDSTIQLDRAQLKDAVEAHKQKHQTGELPQHNKMELPFAMSLPYGLHTRGISEYVVLPKSNPAGGPHWLISFNGLGPEKNAVGIEVAGDVVLGTTRGGSGFPDFDFTKYQADLHGVSRHHAVIRPSHSKLYLIDLRSTNGTRVNALPTNPGMAMELQNGDAVSLGTLTFTVNILATPGELLKAKEEKAKAESTAEASANAAGIPANAAAAPVDPAPAPAQPLITPAPVAQTNESKPAEAVPIAPPEAPKAEAPQAEIKPVQAATEAPKVEAAPATASAPTPVTDAPKAEDKPEASALPTPQSAAPVAPTEAPKATELKPAESPKEPTQGA